MLTAAFLVVSFLVAALQATVQPGSVRHPILLVPGLAGNQIWATLDKPVTPGLLCKRKKFNYLMWFDPGLLVPLARDCFVDNFRLIYDEATHTTSSVEGVTTQIQGWGETGTVEYLTNRRVGPYMHTLLSTADGWGYRRGRDIRAAPYDFRKAPNEMQEYYTNLKTLIEEMYAANGDRKVVVVGHSLGNLISLYFYQHQPDSWKSRYIKAHVSLGGPWGGSPKTIQMFTSGHNLGRPNFVLPPLKMREFQRTWPSSAFLLPSPKFWGPRDVLLRVGNQNYTVANYEQLFTDIGWPTGWKIWRDVKDLIDPDLAPKVEVHCLIGTSQLTPESFEYSPEAFPDGTPQMTQGAGDGTVPDRSQRGCLRWQGKQSQNLTLTEFPGIEHLELVKNMYVLNYIKRVAVAPERS